MQKFIIFFLIAVLILPLIVFAKIGVGVGTGKIKIDQPLKPGGVYNLPSIGVFNTGDEPGDYEMGVAYHSDQPELRPAKEWFNFTPSSFYLEPNQSQSVAIRLDLPVKTQPGDYFAYLEGRPVVKDGKGTTITVAAATKVYFTVIPVNIWQAIIYRISYFFNLYAPWTWVVLVLFLGAIVIVIFKKFFSFQIGIKKK
jgi:hypothetical protein